MSAVAVMPRSTQRDHADPAWRGDRVGALAGVATKPAGRDKIHAADRNFQWFDDDPDHPIRHEPGHGTAFCLHYRAPGRNNFPFIVDQHTGHVRRMTDAELVRTKWAAADVHRWRRGPHLNSEHPATYHAMVVEAVRVGVKIIAELKDPAFADRGPAEQVVATAIRAGHPPWFMALYGSMAACCGKCAAIVRAGGDFAVIFGRYRIRYWVRFRREVRSWPVKPTRVW